MNFDRFYILNDSWQKYFTNRHPEWYVLTYWVDNFTIDILHIQKCKYFLMHSFHVLTHSPIEKR